MKKRLIEGVKPVDLSVVLATIYFLVLLISPFEAIDRGIARAMFEYGSPGWSEAWIWSVPLYKGAKIAATILGLGLVGWGIKAYRADNKPLTDAIIRILMAAAIALGLMLLLKQFSGVACPWNLTEFDSNSHRSVTVPFAWLYSDAKSQGACWPAGHASTGFCLFGLWFAARRIKPHIAPLVFIAVLLFGGLCAFARQVQGAHFLSHSIASLLLEFAVAGLVFWPDSREKKTMSVTQAALFSAVTITLLAIPFFGEIAKVATVNSILAMFASMLHFAVLWTGFFLLVVRLMPEIGWRVTLVTFAVIGAGADAFTALYGTVMTPDMVRNALATDWHEATELVSMRWALHSVVFALPAVAVAILSPKIAVETSPNFRGKLFYITNCVLIFVMTAGSLLSQFSTLSAFMRNQKDARYLIEPVAVMYSFVRTMVSDGAPTQKNREVLDPAPALAEAKSEKPLLVVLVVGETVRAGNWGLNGYARNTTPELARRNVINFTDVTACGTSTDVSLPCMFSRVGRSNYDRDRILAEESVLSVIERAGVKVRWVDNQSGCKGACTAGMEVPVTRNDKDCPSGICFDGAMIGNVHEALADTTPRSLLVLHSMGNHGPAYWRRSPATLRPFGNGCLKDDLGECTTEKVVASYDNAVAYADRFLSETIDLLARDNTHDAVLLYVSDHGESLGEKGLWLHGAPYWTKLDEQIKVPMILWMNESARARYGIKTTSGNVTTAVSHDNLADTLFDLTGTATKLFNEKESLLTLLK